MAAEEISPCSTKHTGKVSFALHGNGRSTSTTPDDTFYRAGMVLPTNTDKQTACIGKCVLGPPNANLPGRKRSTYHLATTLWRALWAKRLSGSILAIGAFFWYKAIDSLWWLGKVQGHMPEANDFHIVRFLDDPGPVKITLSPP